MKILNKVFNYIENKQITIKDIFITLFAFLIIRNFFEIGYKNNMIIYASDDILYSLNIMFFTYGFYWFFLYFLLCLTLYTITRKNNTIRQVLNIGLFSMLIIFLGPFIDMIADNKSGMAYPTNPLEMFTQIQYWLHLDRDISKLTPGMRYETLLACTSGIFYTFYKTKKIILSVATFPILFTVISISGLWPSLLGQIISGGLSFTEEVSFKGSIVAYNGMIIEFGFVRWGLIYLISSFFLASTVYYIINKEQFIAIIKNFRITRSLHYLLLFFAGVFFSYHIQSIDSDFEATRGILNVIDFFDIGAAAFAGFLSFQAAVIFNDISDISSDKMLEYNRPLVKSKISKEQYKFIGFLFLIYSLFIAFIIGIEFFIIISILNSFSYLYSNYPIRLKKYLIVNNMILGLIALTSFYLGLSIFFENKSIMYAEKYIPNISLILFAGYTIATTIKDPKDFEGDKAAGIQTLVTVFGMKAGKIIIASLIAILIVSMPQMLNIKELTALSGITALIFLILFFAIKKNELWIFLTYFAFMIVLFYRLIGTLVQ